MKKMKKMKIIKIIFALILIFNSNTFYAQLDCECPPNSDPYIIDGTMPGGVNISSILPTIDWEVNCIILSGQLNIDVNAVIEYAEIKCEPGSVIKILSDNKLTIKGSYLHGCTKLWKGIEVNDATKLYMKGTTIEDAEYGVHIKDECTLNCTNNIFRNNYIGIYASGNNIKNVNGIPLGDCYFEQTELLKPNYDGSEIGQQENSFAGIYLNNVSYFEIGQKLTIDEEEYIIHNTFNGMKNGIVSVGSKVGIWGAIVNNLIEPGSYTLFSEYSDPNLLSGSAFYSNGGDFKIYDCQTSNCPFSYISFNSSNRIFDCDFINEENTYYQSASVYINEPFKWYSSFNNFYNNSIKYGANYGYYIENSNWSIAIFNNKITSFTVYFENINDFFHFNDNIVNSDIKVNNSNSWGLLSFFHNEITPYSSEAFYASNSDKVWVKNNYFHRKGNFDRAMEFYSTNNVELECNYINEYYKGLGFFDISTASIVKSQTFNNNTNSILLTETEIGDQPYRGNVFIGDNTGVIDGSDPVSIADNSKFTFNPNDPPDEGGLEPTNYDPAIIENVWFVENDERNNEFCNPSNTGGDVEERVAPWWTKLSCDSLGKYLDSTLFTTIKTPYKNQFLWQKQRYFLKNMKLDSMLRDTCEYVDSILTIMYGDTIDRFVETEIEIRNAEKLSADLDEQLNVLLLNINNIAAQIDNIDSLMIIDTINIEIYLTQKKELLDELNPLISESKNIYMQFESQRRSKWESALAAVERLDASTIYQLTQKRYWQFYLKERLYGIGSITQSEWEEIGNMANLCPLEAGRAVYGARTLYKKFSRNAEFDDNLICEVDKMQELTIRNDGSTLQNDLKIYPNPTNDYLNVEFTNEDEKEVKIEIVDTRGNVLNKFDLGVEKDISDQIQTDKLFNGVYFANIYFDNKLVKSVKIVKIK